MWKQENPAKLISLNWGVTSQYYNSISRGIASFGEQPSVFVSYSTLVV